jgi:hypothetical protein
MVKELLLGDNAFLGVSHISQEKARSEQKEATLENKAKVMEVALEGGATGFTFTTHPSNLEMLKFIHAQNPEILRALNYYILVPHAQMYVRKANFDGTPSLVASVFKDLVHTRKSSVFDALSALITFEPKKFATLFIEMELAPYLKILPKKNIKAVLLHEVFTELIMAHGLFDLAQDVGVEIEKRFGPTCFGFETRNFGYLQGFLERFDYYPKFLMTPFNSLGYQMAPDKEAVEKAVDAVKEKSNVIAINVLASGALTLEESIAYSKKHEDSLYAVSCSSSKPQRIHSNFQILSQAFLQNNIQAKIP